MTVAELIEKLRELPPESRVTLQDAEAADTFGSGYYEATDVQVFDDGTVAIR